MIPAIGPLSFSGKRNKTRFVRQNVHIGTSTDQFWVSLKKSGQNFKDACDEAIVQPVIGRGTFHRLHRFRSSFLSGYALRAPHCSNKISFNRDTIHISQNPLRDDVKAGVPLLEGPDHPIATLYSGGPFLKQFEIVRRLPARPLDSTLRSSKTKRPHDIFFMEDSFLRDLYGPNSILRPERKNQILREISRHPERIKELLFSDKGCQENVLPEKEYLVERVLSSCLSKTQGKGIDAVVQKLGLALFHFCRYERKCVDDLRAFANTPQSEFNWLAQATRKLLDNGYQPDFNHTGNVLRLPNNELGLIDISSAPLLKGGKLTDINKWWSLPPLSLPQLLRPYAAAKEILARKIDAAIKAEGL